MFVEEMIPSTTMCTRHNSECNQDCLHLLPQPHNTLVSNKGYQLFHAVIKTHKFKQMRTKKYSNIFQIHAQRGFFQGIDTCDVTSVGKFAYLSVLLDESESRTIVCRSDINALLENLHREKLLTADYMNARR